MAILVLSPNGTHTTKTTLEAARTAADVAGKTVIVTSALTQAQSNLTGAWPTDRALEFKKGGSVAQSTAFAVNGSLFSAPLAQVFTGAGAVTGLRESHPEWFGAVGDGTTDDANAVLSAGTALDIGGVLYLHRLYGVSAGVVAFTSKSIYIKGVLSSHTYAGKTGFKALSDGTFILQLGELVTSGASYKVGTKMQNVFLDGNSHTFTVGGLVLYGLVNPDFGHIAINGLTGNGMFLREIWQANFDRILMRQIIATTAGQAVVLIGDKYNSDIEMNCNVLKFSNGCQFEENKGTYFRSTGDSNLDGLQIDHSEFENRNTTADGWTLFDFVEGVRINIHHNEFMRFFDVKGYSTFLKLGSDGSTTKAMMTDNIINGNSATTVQANVGVSSYLRFTGNYAGVVDEVLAHGTLVNASKFAIDYEHPMTGDSGGYRFMERDQYHYLSANRIANNNNKLVADADSINLEQTAMKTSVAGEPLVYIGGPQNTRNLFRDTPSIVRVVARAKSATGTGKLQLQVHLDTWPEIALTTAWALYTFDVPIASFAAFGDNAADRFLIKAGNTSPAGEDVYLDGIWVSTIKDAQAAAQTNSVAADLAALIVDFNALLAKLRTAELMAP